MYLTALVKYLCFCGSRFVLQNSPQWRWYSRLLAVLSLENTLSYLASPASLQLWIWAKQSGQAGCTHESLPLHMHWAWTQETLLGFGRACADTRLLVEEQQHAILTPSLSALSSPETLQQQKATLKEECNPRTAVAVWSGGTATSKKVGLFTRVTTDHKPLY